MMRGPRGPAPKSLRRKPDFAFEPVEQAADEIQEEAAGAAGSPAVPQKQIDPVKLNALKRAHLSPEALDEKTTKLVMLARDFLVEREGKLDTRLLFTAVPGAPDYLRFSIGRRNADLPVHARQLSDLLIGVLIRGLGDKPEQVDLWSPAGDKKLLALECKRKALSRREYWVLTGLVGGQEQEIELAYSDLAALGAWARVYSAA